MKAREIRKDIYWVGGIDWNLRNFHGYETPRGSTYNAYLVMDDKITLVDTVKYHLVDEMLERISSVVDPRKIDYVVSNHVEMDHSGGLPRIMQLASNAAVVASPQGERGLREHYRQAWDFVVRKTGETLGIGSRNLAFVQTPMIHWPDNMVTYLPEEKILFSRASLRKQGSSASSETRSAQFLKRLSARLRINSSTAARLGESLRGSSPFFQRAENSQNRTRFSEYRQENFAPSDFHMQK